MTKTWILLGSCRVVNTIAHYINNDIVLNIKDLWFTHYPHEHIQKINHLFGVRSIPREHKELFVRFEQQNHYESHSQFRVGDSIDSGKVEFQSHSGTGTINVAVELPTNRYIKVPTNDGVFWGHITNLELIRNSPFNQVGGNYTDEDFLETLNDFEQILIDLVSSSGLAEAVNFIYVPHNPFIELKEGSWGISGERVRIFDLIRQHCAENTLPTKLPMHRCSLDVKTMIDENGGVKYMLEDQNHYTTHGRKVAFKHLNELAIF
ncbi:hypothetical protein [Aeromonas sp. R5-1]|uniref:hypothetical protein n=1 Tax=Aeromonas TaxID=642 RepID=UPI0034A50CA8